MLENFATAMLAGAIIYLVTRLSLGDRANSLPGGAAAAGLMITPWWIGVIGGVLGHVIAVMAFKRVTLYRKNQDSNNG
jgi:hypothetical protein